MLKEVVENMSEYSRKSRPSKGSGLKTSKVQKKLLMNLNVILLLFLEKITILPLLIVALSHV